MPGYDCEFAVRVKYHVEGEMADNPENLTMEELGLEQSEQIKHVFQDELGFLEKEDGCSLDIDVFESMITETA